MTETADIQEPTFMIVGDGAAARRIALRIRAAAPGSNAPTLVWLCGYRSDMGGTKVVELDALAGRLGLATLRFDYSGHGLSDGHYTDGTISLWLEEALAVLDAAHPQRVILIGSSMGGWIALRLAQEIRKRGTGPALDGMVLIAPAPDFTSALIEPNLTDLERTSLAERGFFEEPSDYGPEPTVFTRALIEDGRAHTVLTGIIDVGCPVHILQGMRDADVPYRHAVTLMEHLPADDVVLTLIRDGDHRLSRPQDMERLFSAVTALVKDAATAD